MINIKQMLDHNKKFVENEASKAYETTKYPDKKVAILTCMDTRLTELLLAALNLRNGDVKIIKNAGAVVSHPFDSVMRSILISVYDLEVEEIMVVGHMDCGMERLEPETFINKMLDRGIKKETIEMIKYCGTNTDRWLRGFDSAKESVLQTVDVIRKHPLMPEDVSVYGFLIDPVTGKLDTV